MQTKLPFLTALVLVAIGGLPATAAVPVDLGHLSSHSPSGPSPMPGMDNMPGMDHGGGTTNKSSQDRPLKPVLGVFGVGTSAVLLGAGFLRRKDAAHNKAKEANIASRRNRK